MIAVVAGEVEHAGVVGRLHRIVEPAGVVEPDHSGRARLPADGQREHADRPLGRGAFPEVGDDLRVAEVDVQVVERRVEGGVGTEEIDHDQPERQQAGSRARQLGALDRPEPEERQAEQQRQQVQPVERDHRALGQLRAAEDDLVEEGDDQEDQRSQRDRQQPPGRPQHEAREAGLPGSRGRQHVVQADRGQQRDRQVDVEERAGRHPEQVGQGEEAVGPAVHRRVRPHRVQQRDQPGRRQEPAQGLAAERQAQPGQEQRAHPGVEPDLAAGERPPVVGRVAAEQLGQEGVDEHDWLEAELGRLLVGQPAGPHRAPRQLQRGQEHRNRQRQPAPHRQPGPQRVGQGRPERAPE
ncbi:hypothetical protein HRbin26_00975 [bacterium HR26]|nr:hypothetical protein HRbin26_00975 [bacterium HR26]